MLAKELREGGGWFRSDTSPSMLAFCAVDTHEPELGAAEPSRLANGLSPAPDIIVPAGPPMLMPGTNSGPKTIKQKI